MLPWIRLATRKRSGNAGEAWLNAARRPVSGGAKLTKFTETRFIA